MNGSNFACYDKKCGHNRNGICMKADYDVKNPPECRWATPECRRGKRHE